MKFYNNKFFLHKSIIINQCSNVMEIVELKFIKLNFGLKFVKDLAYLALALGLVLKILGKNNFKYKIASKPVLILKIRKGDVIG